MRKHLPAYKVYFVFGLTSCIWMEFGFFTDLERCIPHGGPPCNCINRRIGTPIPQLLLLNKPYYQNLKIYTKNTLT